MRILPGLLLAALLLATLPTMAQPPTFSQPYQVRGALGDIPTTPTMEPSGLWNLEQRLTVAFTNATERQVVIALPSGAAAGNATCDCAASANVQPTQVVFTFPKSMASGTYTLRVATSQHVGSSFGFDLAAPSDVPAASDRVAILYVPVGSTFDAPATDSGPGLSTDGQSRIVVLASLPSPLWVVVHPGMATVAPAQPTSSALTWPVALGAGVVLGVLLWAFLVQKGAVQRKGRKQVAGTAAHVEAAASESPAVLEGKKRALLAALKEVEVAKMNNEMPPEVYDAVKADLKKQAVTVMRALESGADKAAAE